MIRELHNKLINKEISAKELAEQYLDKIKESDLNAFITTTQEDALADAQNVDSQIAQGHELPILAGIPASIKDVIQTAGVRTTAGSKILDNYIAPYNATLVQRLKDAGLVLLGKNNCDEFAMGGSNENSAYGPVKNPHNKECVPGGSSGGSAASVADGLVVYSIGTDTGGSVRQPAALCGIVGFKPTYGAISRYGLIAMASSLDQAGILAKSVEDVKIVFDAIKGRDKMDSTSLNIPDSKFQIPDSNLKGIKIGVPKEYFIKGIDPEIESAVKDTIKQAEEAGAKIVEVSLPHTKYALAVYYIIMPAEVSANLARYDGIRYGQSEPAKNLFKTYTQTRAQHLGDEVKRRIMLGTYTLSAGYYDAYYKKAQQVRTLIKQDFEKVFKEADLLITPTTPNPAWKIGEKIDDPLTMYLEDIFTVPVNVASLPAMSIPAGKTKNGLPIGAQLIGPWNSEENLFTVGEILEKEINF